MPIARSLLYCPGNRPRMIARAPESDADALIFDLADSVPVDEKATARRLVGDAIVALHGRRIYVKLNDLDDGLLADDLDAVVVEGLSGVMLPKASVVADVTRLDLALAEQERRRGLPPGSVQILLLIETPQAILRVYDLARASSRVTAVCFGSAEGGDLIDRLGCAWSLLGPERMYARSRVVLAARAARVPMPLDGVFVNLEDPVGLETEADLARRLGYVGKLVIHPKQVETVNRIFTPLLEEVANAHRILEAHEQASREGRAYRCIDGVLSGPASARRAKAVLARAAALGVREE